MSSPRSLWPRGNRLLPILLLLSRLLLLCGLLELGQREDNLLESLHFGSRWLLCRVFEVFKDVCIATARRIVIV